VETLNTAQSINQSDWVKPSFLIFDFWVLTLSPDRQSVRMSKIANGGLTRHRMLYGCTHMATVGVKGLICYSAVWLIDPAASVE